MTQNSKKLVIVGMGGHGRVIFEAALASGKYEILGFVDEKPGSPRQSEYLGNFDILKTLDASVQVIVAIGDNSVRESVAGRLKAIVPGVTFATIIHPFSFVASDAAVGAGSVIFAGAVVQSSVRIAEHVVVNTGACVDHDGVLKDFSSVGPGAVLGGEVTIGKRAFVALGAKVKHGLVIADDVVLGAGSMLLADLSSACVAVGVPAKFLKSRAKNDSYL